MDQGLLLSFLLIHRPPKKECGMELLILVVLGNWHKYRPSEIGYGYSTRDCRCQLECNISEPGPRIVGGKVRVRNL